MLFFVRPIGINFLFFTCTTSRTIWSKLGDINKGDRNPGLINLCGHSLPFAIILLKFFLNHLLYC
jgi:hypothetical protein